MLTVGRRCWTMAQLILLIDQNLDRALALRSELSDLGYETLHATDRFGALKLHASHRFEATLADLDSWCAGAQERSNVLGGLAGASPVVVLTELAGIESAAQALKAGAFLYLVRPLGRDKLEVALQLAFASRTLHIEDTVPRKARCVSVTPPSLIASGRAMRETVKWLLKAARSEANVLLLGESGTGKELVAHEIHALSARAKHPFVAVDCASLPESLLEAELFGYEKGAFTGADRIKQGLMEAANHGTLFLDEIGELPLALQPKLLRAVQEREHRRVGGLQLIKFDVRIISATNRDLRSYASEGRFREDLFYRLHVLPIHLPPLRERPDEVAPLARHFLAQYSETRNPPILNLEPDALQRLQDYSWPGNVRELQNAIEYACAVAEGDTIFASDLPPDCCGQPKIQPGQSPSGRLAAKFKVAKTRFEMEFVSDLLQQHNGNVSAAAKAAGVDRGTLYHLLNKHQVSYVRDLHNHQRRLRVVRSQASQQ